MHIGNFWRKPKLFSKYSWELSKSHGVFRASSFPRCPQFPARHRFRQPRWRGLQALRRGPTLPVNILLRTGRPPHPRWPAARRGLLLQEGSAPPCARPPSGWPGHSWTGCLFARAASCLGCAGKIPGTILMLPFPFCTPYERQDLKGSIKKRERKGPVKGRVKVLHSRR